MFSCHSDDRLPGPCSTFLDAVSGGSTEEARGPAPTQLSAWPHRWPPDFRLILYYEILYIQDITYLLVFA